MAEITIVRLNTVSGTSYVLDVSSLALVPALDVRDFQVTHNGVDRTSLYTKTSATQLTYAGANVTLGTVVQVIRLTPLTNTEVTFISTTTALQLTNALTKLKRRVDELESFVEYQSKLISLGGVTPGVLPIVDSAYSAAWDNDLTNAPSRNSVYDVINRIDTGSNTWTGSYNANGASSVLVPLAPTNDISARAASTTFTRNAIDDRLRLLVNRTTSVNLVVNSVQDLPLNNTIVNRDSYNAGTFTWTAPSAGVYLFQMFALPIATGGTIPTKTLATALLRINSSDFNMGATEIDKEFAYAMGTYVASLAAGDTVRPRILVEPANGTGYTYTVGGNAAYRPEFAIYKLT